MNKTKNIAIIAFDNKKTELIEWSYFNKDFLLPHNILALGFAVNILEGTLNKKVNTSESAKQLSEYRQLNNHIKDGQVDAIIVFGEAKEILESKDLSILLETAIQNNITVAANKTTADFVLHSSLLKEEYAITRNEKIIPANNQAIQANATLKLAKAS